jgi:hypothetical protein
MSTTAPARRALRRVAATLGALVVCSPGLARACAVCGGGANDQTQAGFLAGTLLLSILPLALIGGIALWIRRRARLMAEEATGGIRLPDRPAPRPASHGSPQPAAR